jgi:hypothetical protein
VPGRFPMLREAALALFLVAIALGLWLAELRPLAVVGVMALALAVAWVIEWLSWREDQIRGAAPLAGVAPPEVVEETVGLPAAPPRARGLWLLRGDRAARAAARASEQVGAGDAPPGSEPAMPAAPEPEAPAPAKPAAPEPSSPEPAARETAAPQPAVPESPPQAAEEPPPSRRRLQPVRSAAPPPPPEPPAPAAPREPQDAPVVPLWARSSQPREWNLWDLERIARAQTRRDPERFEEMSYLFLHLRRFANADGVLPAEFDGLVRDAFGGLLEPAQGA